MKLCNQTNKKGEVKTGTLDLEAITQRTILEANLVPRPSSFDCLYWSWGWPGNETNLGVRCNQHAPPTHLQVTRVVAVELGKGEGEVVLKNLSKSLDKDSVRVDGIGPASVTEVSFQVSWTRCC